MWVCTNPAIRYNDGFQKIGQPLVKGIVSFVGLVTWLSGGQFANHASTVFRKFGQLCSNSLFSYVDSVLSVPLPIKFWQPSSKGYIYDLVPTCVYVSMYDGNGGHYIIFMCKILVASRSEFSI